MNLLNQSIKHHEYSDQYKHQFLPIVGAAASVPTVFISGAKAVTNLFFSAIYIPQCKNKEASECFWAARDLVLVFANNLLNIATLGILNSVLLNAGLLKIDNASPGVSPPANPPFPNPAGVPIQRGGQPLPVPLMPSTPPPSLPPNPARAPIHRGGQPLPVSPWPSPTPPNAAANPAIKQICNHGESPSPSPAPSFVANANSFPQVRYWTDLDGTQVQGNLKLLPGKHSVQLQHNEHPGKSKGSVVEITTQSPIYFCNYARFGNMSKKGPCVVMQFEDFQTIQKTFRQNAFESDYSPCGNGHMVAWTIPAELLYIADYHADQTPVFAGCNPLRSQSPTFVDPLPAQWAAQLCNATKFRIDKKFGPFNVESVHYFEIQGADGKTYYLAGISSGAFFQNFNVPTQQEWTAVQTMLDTLRGYGISGFICNQAHRAIIFYAYSDSSSRWPIGPLDFAGLLQNDGRIFAAIQAATDKNLNQWKTAMIENFKPPIPAPAPQPLQYQPPAQNVPLGRFQPPTSNPTPSSCTPQASLQPSIAPARQPLQYQPAAQNVPLGRFQPPVSNSGPSSYAPQASPQPSIAPAPALQAASIPETINWVDLDGAQVQGRLKLLPGNQNIQLQHDRYQGFSKGAIISVAIQKPIYGFHKARFGKMRKKTACLVMSSQDFQTIQRTIHSGAFGTDYSDLGNGFHVLWKIPADILYFENYQVDDMQVDVGDYQLYPDNRPFADRLPAQLVAKGQDATKLRIDRKFGPYDPESVHCFAATGEDGQEYTLSGISTGNFFGNFNDPQDDEWKKVMTMLSTLKEYGIDAFLCNSTHHAVIFYAYANDPSAQPTLIRPVDFAKLLQCDERIFQAIKAAANKDMERWRKAYMETFNK